MRNMVADSMRSRLSILLVFSLAMGLALIAGAAATESRDSACAACHLPPETRFVARSLADAPADLASAHAVMEEALRCIDCHSSAGSSGRLQAIGLGAMDLLSHVRGDYLVVGQEYLPFGGLAHPGALRECRSCHEESIGAPGHENHFHNLLDDPEAPSVACAACHGAHRLGMEPPYFVEDASVAGGCSHCHAVMGGPSSPFGMRLGHPENPALALLRPPAR